MYQINIEEFHTTKIFLDTDYILPDNITLNNSVVLMTSVIKDDGKSYLQIFLEEVLHDE